MAILKEFGEKCETPIGRQLTAKTEINFFFFWFFLVFFFFGVQEGLSSIFLVCFDDEVYEYDGEESGRRN